jgi:acetyl esterase/lipase
MERQCRLDLYYPVDRSGYATIVWFHGGGLIGGEKSIPDALRNRGWAVVAANYRLSPEVFAPAYIEDAAAAVAWVFQHISEYGGDPERVIVSGHSAGGYLASMVGLDKRWLAAYGIDANAIAAVVPFSGHAITHFTIRKERGIPETQVVVDDLAPLYHVRADAPDYVMITGDRDLELLGRYEENAYMWRMMQQAGNTRAVLHEIKGAGHSSMVDRGMRILIEYLKARHF